MRLIPLTGVPLPLVSYGGTSRVATAIVLALLVRTSAGPWFRAASPTAARPPRSRPMDRQIRRLGIAFVALFAVLFAQVAYVQVVAADRIANQPANAARQIRAEYAVERGQILAADRKTVLAESIPNEDPNSPYLFVRQYPLGELFGQLTGYYSQIYGRTGLEQAMNPYLAGTAPEFTTQNLTDIILGRPQRGGTVLTTLDAEPAARSPARRSGDLQGAVVAIDPSNGDVLAMYSNPGYRPAAAVERHPRPDPSRRGRS